MSIREFANNAWQGKRLKYVVAYSTTRWEKVASKKVSVSLPEDLLRKIDEAAVGTRTSRSEFIAKILEESIGASEEKSTHEYPTVFWKLKSTGYLRARSPRYPSRSIGQWVVEEVPTQ